jgi:hypothetical protein
MQETETVKAPADNSSATLREWKASVLGTTPFAFTYGTAKGSTQ